MAGPEPDDIAAQLTRMFASPAFAASRRRRTFLTFLVDEALAGRGDRLKGTTVAHAVFGRDETFDTNIDPIVRMEARRLRRDLDSYYIDEGRLDAIRITIPKGAYIPFFAWQADPSPPTSARLLLPDADPGLAGSRSDAPASSAEQLPAAVTSVDDPDDAPEPLTHFPALEVSEPAAARSVSQPGWANRFRRSIGKRLVSLAGLVAVGIALFGVVLPFRTGGSPGAVELRPTRRRARVGRSPRPCAPAFSAGSSHCAPRGERKPVTMMTADQYRRLGRLVRGALPLAAFLVATASAEAADIAAPPVEQAPAEKKWDVAIAAHVWGASLSGEVGVGRLGPAKVDASFGDILSDLDIAFMAVAEARYGRFGVLADLLCTEVSAAGSGPLGFVDADVTCVVTVSTLMGEARVLGRANASVDLMAGGRLWTVSTDVRLSGPLGARSASASETWIDPMIGAKGRVENAAGVFLTGWAMVGGFGVGYEVTDHISIVAGYRGLGVDYDSGDFLFDIVEHGPVISGVVRF